MAELVRCPRCGCSVQVADTLLGRRVRCFGCQHLFLADADRTPARPTRPPAPRPRRQPFRDDEESRNGSGEPFCPGCGRRITWGDLVCPFCGEELEPEDDARQEERIAERIRRDLDPHRGPLIVSLGNISMVVGGLSLCMFGAGVLISVPLGVLAWLMANRDLALMSEGRMDPNGRRQTETGRTGAIAGIVLGLIFAAFYVFIYLAK